MAPIAESGDAGAESAPTGVTGCDVCGRVLEREVFVILPDDELDLRTIVVRTNRGRFVSFEVKQGLGPAQVFSAKLPAPPDDAADDSFALAFALNQRSHRYAEARAVLDDVRAWVGPYPDGRAREAYYRGTLATETGDARTAMRLLAAARAHAARLGLGVLERNAINAYALQLELVGRVHEALDLLRELETIASASKDASPCEKVEIAINLGFGALLAGRADRRPKGRSGPCAGA
jgi:hypothetical protein